MEMRELRDPENESHMHQTGNVMWTTQQTNWSRPNKVKKKEPKFHENDRFQEDDIHRKNPLFSESLHFSNEYMYYSHCADETWLQKMNQELQKDQYLTQP